MDRTKYYSGMIPSLEDLEFEQLSKEQSVLNRMTDLFTDGVLTGLKVYISPDLKVRVNPGIAYIQGERTVLLEDTVALEEVADGFVYIKFIQTEWLSQSHFITGEEHFIRLSDSSEIVVKSEDVEEDNELFLAIILDGVVYDKRRFVELKLTTPDFVDPVDKLVLFTGFEADITYTPNLE